MEGEKVKCPKCGAENPIYIKATNSYVCRKEGCEHEFALETKHLPKKIFISYGHDEYEKLALKFKQDLENLGHEVWFDRSELKTGRDWEISIENGLKGTEIVIVMMTDYSMRRPDGYCLNELSMACALRKEILPVMAQDCTPPLSIHRIQYLDFREWPCSEEKYKEKFIQIRDVIEGKLLSFEGSHSYILNKLEPLDFKAEIVKHTRNFYGRQWIFDEIKDWLYSETDSRIFFLTGKPGVGKTAISAVLCHRFPEVKAYHLVMSDDLRKSDALECVLSVAYQLSTQILDYADKLLEINFSRIREKNARTVFDELIIQPLFKIKPPQSPVLIVIDALDEAKKGDENELVSFLSDAFTLTPSWLKLFITSRPEPDILNSLASLKPRPLDTEDERNLTDIREYLEVKLAELFKEKPISEAIEIILKRSEGVFLYIQEVLNELKLGRLDLEHPEEFPMGLKQVYKSFFKRQFPKIEEYKNYQRPLLELIAAAKEPLEISTVREILEWDDYSEKDSIEPLGSFVELSDDKLKFFHRSIGEWLTDKQTGKDFYISIQKGHEIIAKYGWSVYKTGVSNMSDYLIAYLPLHLLALDNWDDLNELMSNREYIAKIEISTLKEFPESLLQLYYNVKPEQFSVLIELKTMTGVPIPRMDFYEIDKEIGVKITDKEVVRLVVKKKRLTQLPDSIGILTSLNHLDLSENRLELLPDSIGSLEQLKSLELKKNPLKTLPETITNLKSLTFKDSYELFDFKKYSDIKPKQSKFMTDLEIILRIPITVVDEINHTTFGVKISNNEVIELGLPACGLTIVLGSIGNLTSLTYLNLRDNNIKILPDSIGNLKSLTYLNLRNNELEILPESIGNLTSLTYLSLRDNYLTALPKSIENLKSLEHKLSIESRKDFFMEKKSKELQDIYAEGGTSLIKNIDTLWAYLFKTVTLLSDEQKKNFNIGEFVKIMGFENEIELYDKLIERDPEDKLIWLDKGKYLTTLKRYEEAIESFDKALEIDPKFGEAWLKKGYALFDLKRYEESIKCHDKALEINPNYSDAWLNKGINLAMILDEQISSTDDETYKSSLLKRYKEVIEFYDKALDIEPEEKLAWYSKGITLFRMLNKKDEAIECYNKALGIDPNYKEVLLDKALILDGLNRQEEAIECYNKIISIDPKNRDAWFNKGLVLDNLKEYEEAAECFNKVLSIDPRDKIAWFDKGLVLSKLSRYEEALECYEKALSIDDKYILPLFNKAVALHSLNKFEEAITFYDKALELDPKYKKAWHNKGVAYSNLGKFEEAIEYYDKALSIDPEDEFVWYDKGVAFHNLNRLEEAIECYNKALNVNPENKITMNNKAIALYSLEKYDDVIKMSDKIIEIDPEYRDAWLNKGASLAMLKKYDQADECYDKSLELDINFSLAWYNKACMESLRNNKEKSIEFLRKAIQLDNHWKGQAAKEAEFDNVRDTKEFQELIS